MSDDAPWEDFAPPTATNQAGPTTHADEPWKDYSTPAAQSSKPLNPATDFSKPGFFSQDVPNALAGFGEGIVNAGRRIHQVAHKFGLASDNQDEIDEAARLDAPLNATKAGMAGNIAAQTVPMLLAPEAGILGSAIEGAGTAALTQPTVTGGPSTLQNAGMGAMGGAAGAAIGKGIGLLGGFGVPGERQAAVNILNREEIPTSVAQKTAAKGAQQIERASGALTDAQREFEESQQPAFNAAVLRRIGVNPQGPLQPLTGSQVLAAIDPARDAMTATMDRVAANNPVRLDNRLMNELAQHEWNAARQIPTSDLGPIHTSINDILDAATQPGSNDAMDGIAYQKIYSNLGALSKNPAQAPIASGIRESLRQAMLRSTNGQDAADLAEAMRQYRAIKQIEPAIDRATGNISVLKLLGSMGTKDNVNQALYGQGDQSLMELARAAATVIPDRLGNSGTAERMLGPLTALEIARSGEAGKGAVKAAAAVYGGGLMGRAMRNQGIVGNTLATGVPGLRTVAPALQTVAPAAGYAELQRAPRDDVPARATGGKVGPSDDELCDRLMARWRKAKRETDAATKPLLTVPDATIAAALRASGSGL